MRVVCGEVCVLRAVRRRARLPSLTARVDIGDALQECWCRQAKQGKRQRLGFVGRGAPAGRVTLVTAQGVPSLSAFLYSRLVVGFARAHGCQRAAVTTLTRSRNMAVFVQRLGHVA